MKKARLSKLKTFTTAFLFFLISMGIFLSLMSHNINDNSFFNFDSSLKKSSNFLGVFGAYFSDILLRSIGIKSYLVPMIFFIWSFVILKNKKFISWFCVFCFPLLLISLCIFVSLFLKKQLSFLPFENGGFLGEGLKEVAIYYFDESSKSTILYISGIISLVLFFIVLNIKPSEWFAIFKDLTSIIKNTFFFFLSLLVKNNKIGKQNIFNLKTTKISHKRKIITSKKINKNQEEYIFPDSSLLEKPTNQNNLESENTRYTRKNTIMLSNVLNDFNVKGEITSVQQGPIVTLYELTPAPGTKTSAVIGLADDIARSMSAVSTRISAIPGRDAIGIEIPNKKREIVFLKELIDSNEYKQTDYSLPLVLGKNIFGKPVVVDLSKMPHLLVAGTTGSGKSVGINAMILSLLYNLSPEECRLILIDPKMLELSIYQDIPHLLTEVVTDPRKAVIALKWTVKEMETRYQLMTEVGVREIDAYNTRVKKILEEGEIIQKEVQIGFDSETGKPVMEKKSIDLRIFPKIVVVVDELADLMITSGREIEAAIQRLSQMARAAGIHLIVATQRPSVDVITGTIKSNFPTRVSYQVTSKIDSRTILGEQGGEQLLGKGDLLITMIGKKLLRVHGPFVQTHEVESVVNHVKNQGEPEYLESVTNDDENESTFDLELDKGDELYNKAVAVVCREKRASTSFIQRHLQIGYNRAARIIEKMETEGIVSPANHVGRREVLVGKDG